MRHQHLLQRAIERAVRRQLRRNQNGECHVCENEEEDDKSPTLMCSFCNVGIHNSKECLGSIGSVISARDVSNEHAIEVGLSHVLGVGAQEGERREFARCRQETCGAAWW